MLHSIRGHFNNGIITLTEEPPMLADAEVIVTFLFIESNNKKPLRKLGGFEGKVILPEDFNEPLEDLKDYM